MEPENMSRLDVLQQETQLQLDRWIRKISQTETLSADRLAELRDHVIDATLELRKLGITESEAALVAVSRMGRVEDLASEYSKSDSSYVWTQRIFWMCIGFIAIGLADAIIDSLVIGAQALAVAWMPGFAFPGWAMTGFVLSGWACAFLALRQLSTGAAIWRWNITASTFIGITIVLTALATLTKIYGQIVLSRMLGNGEFGDMVLTQHYVSLATYIGLPIALMVFAFHIRQRAQAERFVRSA
jgi:hypothetical protein